MHEHGVFARFRYNDLKEAARGCGGRGPYAGTCSASCKMNTQAGIGESMFESIIGEQLSSVEFVQDYVQLRFDGPTLTAFVWPELRQGEAVIVEFEDGAIICVSLRAEDSVGPEAGHFTNGSSPAEPILQF